MRSLLSKVLLLIAFSQFLILTNADAQDINLLKDLKMVSKKSKVVKHRTNPYIYKNEKSVLKKYNPVSLTFGGLLYIYQNAITYQFAAGCIYCPTCSEFSKRSIKEFGLFKGFLLSADRLSRCSKIAATDIHPLRIDDKSHRAIDLIEYYK